MTLARIVYGTCDDLLSVAATPYYNAKSGIPFQNDGLNQINDRESLSDYF